MSDGLTDRTIQKLQRMLAGPRTPAPPPPPAAEPAPKGQLGKYRLLRMLGPQSWEVSDGRRPNAQVLRVLGATAATTVVSAVCADLKPLAALQHPVIVTYHKLSTIGSNYFTVRDYVDGESLEGKTLDPVAALQVFYEIARAVEFTHERGLVHGALTPPNVIISTTGRPFLVDIAGHQLRARFQAGASGVQPLPRQDVEALVVLFASLISGESYSKVKSSGEVPAVRAVHPHVDPALAAVLQRNYLDAKSLADDVAVALRRLPSEYSASVGLLERYQRHHTRTA